MSHLSPDSVSATGLTAFFHEKIPLTRAMGVEVVECGPDRLVLQAPLDANRNHLGTAFGGSLHALPTLACYGTLWMLVREAAMDSHVVVKRSQAYYRQPVTGTLRAVCQRPAAPRCTSFLAELKRHGKARMDLAARVDGANGKPAVEYSGSFVALL